MRSLALKGDQEAQTYLGQMYAMGYGRVRDHGKAVYWYRKAAEQGEAQAQNNLGVAYAEGQGLPRNYKLAYAWYSLAASQGYGQATANRETIVGRMSSAQIEEAETLSRELAERIASSH